MKKSLKFTLRLHDHIGSITRRYFEFQAPFITQLIDPADESIFRAYVKEIVTDRTHYSDLTSDQKFLHDLGGLIQPVLSAYRAKTRICRLAPRTGAVNASARLEEACQHLGMYCYHFSERVKCFGESLDSIILTESSRGYARGHIGAAIRRYCRSNKRLLKYRNFIVHGPKGRVDEFANLRSWELAGIFLHNDLWLDYNNEFELAQSEWFSIARALIVSMETLLADVQILNENLIATGALSFAASNRQI